MSETIELETWLPIPNYEELYQISSYGRLKALPKLKIHSVYKNEFLSKERIITGGIDNEGYLKVTLTKETIREQYYIHQLVAVVFHNHIINGHEIVIDHIDEDRTNNHKDNLRLLTNEENSYLGKKNQFSKHKGISYCIRDKRWIVRNKINGKRIVIGRFKTEQEAIELIEKAKPLL